MRSTAPAIPPHRRRAGIWGAAALGALLLTGCGAEGDPLSPEESLQTFEILDGFRIELVAAEPYVMDPVEIAFDAEGGLYVAELADNPDDPPPGVKPDSRIVYLEDTDGDGRIDKRTVFADGLLSVEGVQPWKGGVIVAAAPDIVYLKDEDGDHVADTREILYTGFDIINNVEGRISNPRLNLDNWIYLANQGRPGTITSPAHPEMQPLEVRGWDVRFDPLTGNMETASGPAQFGLTFDAYGNEFVAQNTIHIRNVVAPAEFLRRNPYLVVTRAAAEISADGRPAPIYPASQPQQWRVERTAARQERYNETQPGRVEQLGGFFTAAAGSTAYVGDAFPAELVNSVFTGAGNGNLVHCDKITVDGATFAAQGYPQGSDFLTSTDNWFRPVNFANAPDGNLYVVDYYRQYLEHPQFIPDSIKRKLSMDFRNGDDRGRIYRIVPVESAATAPRPQRMGEATSQELVDLLGHPNGWHRRTAQRLLLERQDASVIPALRAMAADSESPLARLHALWTLDGLDALEVDPVRQALGDADAEVRRHALRMARPMLPELVGEALALLRDESPQVRFQAALLLGDRAGEARVADALVALGTETAEDEWFRLAILSAPPETASSLATRFVNDQEFRSSPTEGKQKLLAGLATTVGARREPAELEALFAALGRLDGAAWHRAGLEGLADGLALEGRERLLVRNAERTLTPWLESSDEELQAAAVDGARFFELPSWMARVRKEAADESLDLERRLFAVRALRGASFDEAAPILEKIVVSPSPQALEAEAVKTLAAFDDPDAGEILLAGWDGYTGESRALAADALLRHRDRVGLLLDAIEAGDVRPESLEEVTRIRLSQFPDEAIQARAAELVQVAASDRAAAVAAYQDALELSGNPEAGKAVFERECSKCHLARAERGRVGPDLSGVNNHDRETLLTAILDPSAAIESRYTNYLIETADGRLYDGLVAAETSATVTLRGEQEDVTLLRSEIHEMRASRVSLMPEGLEDAMSRQEIADVIAYLQAGL